MDRSLAVWSKGRSILGGCVLSLRRGNRAPLTGIATRSVCLTSRSVSGRGRALCCDGCLQSLKLHWLRDTPPRRPHRQSVSSSDNKRSVKGERPERDKEGPYQGSTLNYLTLPGHHLACDSPDAFPNHLSNGTYFGPAKRVFFFTTKCFSVSLFLSDEKSDKKINK